VKRLGVLVAIAAVGLVIAIVAVVYTNRPPQVPTSVALSVTPPFASYVAGTGLTENGRGNVSIAAAVPGVVEEVDVRAGDAVHAGEVLFRIDDRDTRAQLAIAEAGVAQAQANADKLQHRLDYLSRLKGVDRAAISADAYTSAKDDAAAATSAVGVARAEAERLRTQLDRLQVRAPSAGRVLEVNLRPGEMAGEAPSQPLVLLGDDSRMFLRIDVDENDAWRVRPTARAVAYLPGDPRHFIPLRFEYVEPYVKPKTSLTGQATERTDLRVLQVVYSFARGTLPVYLGQQMDAFIEAAPATGSR